MKKIAPLNLVNLPQDVSLQQLGERPEQREKVQQIEKLYLFSPVGINRRGIVNDLPNNVLYLYDPRIKRETENPRLQIESANRSCAPDYPTLETTVS